MSDDNLDQDELDARYREMVDSFIDHANELSKKDSFENVGMALLFAASRFNAFVVSQHAKDKESYQADMPKARKFFQEQYQQMLDENLDDYQSVYEKYAHLVKSH